MACNLVNIEQNGTALPAMAQKSGHATLTYPVLLRVQTLDGGVECMLLRQVMVIQEGFVGKVKKLC